jgi:hypothetical protein
MAERWSVAGAQGLAGEASRLSTRRRKFYPLKVDEQTEKVRFETEGRNNVAGAEFFLAKATRLSAHRKTNPLTVEQQPKKAVADAARYR